MYRCLPESIDVPSDARSTMTYKGGKAGSGVYQQIINQIPPHEVYIEPFLGGGAVLLRKRLASSSIGIDVDASVIDGWNGRVVPGATFINGDAISHLQNRRYDHATFVYADPPYLMETRKSKRAAYTYEFGDVGQHEKLLEVLRSLPCMVAVSGYWSELYGDVLKDWRSISFNSVTRSGKVAREWLWMNYPEPLELHDYSYLGENFREREKITRQKKRWVARLNRMDQLQRFALLNAIAEYKDAAVSS